MQKKVETKIKISWERSQSFQKIINGHSGSFRYSYIQSFGRPLSIHNFQMQITAISRLFTCPNGVKRPKVKTRNQAGEYILTHQSAHYTLIFEYIKTGILPPYNAKYNLEQVEALVSDFDYFCLDSPDLVSKLELWKRIAAVHSRLYKSQELLSELTASASRKMFDLTLETFTCCSCKK